ncbi:MULTISPECIES: thrombospondin type 3 repeat-containing protein [Haloferax]|uniref:Matrixin n=1 Tax=Haloferax marinum TaxID=2666143 RepID=A0A6A8G9M9_9EURY|nr:MULTISPECIES: thrombospondin type 3 repeat-containing protein [Haloferax]KAB1197928.1 hypothetical protein Hfx1150_10525 [Haloferax sp. CBA1150]MRW96993.1 hypothetical protein [Haloferax marinum]
MVPIRLIVIVSLLVLPVMASATVAFSPAAVTSSASFDSGVHLSDEELASEVTETPVGPESGIYVTPTTDAVDRPPLKSEPVWSDSDGDGLDDRLESSVGTDAFTTDTDGDGLDDWDEVVRYPTDPLNPDTDGDGFSDSIEYRLGLSPTISDVTDSPDTDGDGLSDSVERRIGTDPTVQDTDGDNLGDGVEVYGSPQQFPDANPLRKDLYFEVDAYYTATINWTALNNTAAFFASAPVENPDGSTGFAVHFVVDETDLTALRVANVSHPDRVVADFDRAGRGYQYIFVAESVFIEDRQVRASANMGRIAIDGPDQTDRLYVHEIGHLLGVHGSDSPGVDSHALSIAEYPSIMSYEYLNSNHPIQMAAGTESAESNDDWDDIRRRFTRWVDTSELDPPGHRGQEIADDGR